MTDGPPEAATAPLRSLIEHFERQVERRLDAPPMPDSDAAELPQAADTLPDPARPEMDDELQIALAALKSLSEQSRKN